MNALSTNSPGPNPFQPLAPLTTTLTPGTTTASLDPTPVLATIAPTTDPTLSPDAEYIAEGYPVYDYVGPLRHKHRLFWRRRLVAIQGPYLLYFRNIELAHMTQEDLIHVVDLRNDVEVVVDPYAHSPATCFSIVGLDVPDGGMYFQAANAAECAKWCKAIQTAINGRCQRCVIEPAKTSRHKYCVQCTEQRHQEKERERNQRACARLRSLLLLQDQPAQTPDLQQPKRHGALSPLPALDPLGERHLRHSCASFDFEDSSSSVGEIGSSSQSHVSVRMPTALSTSSFASLGSMNRFGEVRTPPPRASPVAIAVLDERAHLQP